MMRAGERQIEILRTLADNTDGLAIVNTNDLASGFGRITDDLSAYYLLGYASTNTTLDGKFRQIEVKLVNPQGASISARKGYVAAAPAAAASPSSSAASASAVADALAHIGHPGPGTHAFVGESAGFRGTSSPRVPLQPAPDMEFRRTERLHLEWPVLKPLDQRIARLLDRNGRPLALGVPVTEQGDKVLADLNLASLAEGEYVVELTVGAGGEAERCLVGFRVVR
jgi:hypothetical protein